MNFAVPANHRVKLTESKKGISTYGIEKLCNMKVSVITNVIGALGSVTKGLVKGLEDLEITGRVETVQTTFLGSARIL